MTRTSTAKGGLFLKTQCLLSRRDPDVADVATGKDLDKGATRWSWRAVFSSTRRSPRTRSLPSSSSTNGFSLWPQGRSKIFQRVSNATRTGLPYIGRLCFRGGDSPLRGPAIFRKTDLRAMPVLRQYSFQEHAFPPLPGPEIPSQEGFQILFARSHVHPIACHPILYGIWVTFYVIQCGSLTSGGFRHTMNVPAATPVVRKKMR